MADPRWRFALLLTLALSACGGSADSNTCPHRTYQVAEPDGGFSAHDNTPEQDHQICAYLAWLNENASMSDLDDFERRAAAAIAARDKFVARLRAIDPALVAEFQECLHAMYAPLDALNAEHAAELRGLRRDLKGKKQ